MADENLTIVEATPQQAQVETPITPAVEAEAAGTVPEVKTEPAQRAQDQTVPRHRFNEVYRKTKDLERELQDLKARQSEPVNKPQKPLSADDFDNVEDFNRAWVRQEADKRYDERMLQDKAERQSRDLDARFDAASKNARQNGQEAAIKYPDYFDALEASRDNGILFNQDVSLAIAESKISGDLMYHLATNQADAEHLMRLSPDKALTEVGRLESKLKNGVVSKPVIKTTSAPAPVETVGAVRAKDVDPYSANASMEDFISRTRPLPKPH